jgi:hypothetical protein
MSSNKLGNTITKELSKVFERLDMSQVEAFMNPLKRRAESS